MTKNKKHRLRWLRFLAPRSPLTGVKEIRDGAAFIGSILRTGERKAACRACDNGLMSVVRDQSQGKAITLRCDSCNATVTFDLADAANYLGGADNGLLQRADELSVAATRVAYVAIGILVASSILALVNGAFWTLIGGAIIAASLALQALTLRYRAWQLARRRLFEEQAPIGEWITTDLLPMLGARK